MCISTFARTYGHFSNGFDAKFVVERCHWPRLAVAADVAQTTHRAAVFSADGLMDLPKRGQACSQDLVCKAQSIAFQNGTVYLGIWSLMLSQATQISGNSLSRMHDQIHGRRDCLDACCYRSRRTQGLCNVLSGAVLRAWVFVSQDLSRGTAMTKGMYGSLNDASVANRILGMLVSVNVTH